MEQKSTEGTHAPTLHKQLPEGRSLSKRPFVPFVRNGKGRSMDARAMLFGWYSERQARIGGYQVWRTPSGAAVRCSMLSPTAEHDTIWKDMVPRGEVVEMVSTELYTLDAN